MRDRLGDLLAFLLVETDIGPLVLLIVWFFGWPWLALWLWFDVGGWWRLLAGALGLVWAGTMAIGVFGALMMLGGRR